jgi:hypothetical protein
MQANECIAALAAAASVMSIGTISSFALKTGDIVQSPYGSAVYVKPYASESISPYSLPYDTESGKMFPDSVSNAVSPRTGAAYTLTGTVYGQDPVLGKPKGYTVGTTTISVYSLSAKTDVNNDGTSQATTGWRTLNNTSSVNSGTITAATSHCTFTGYVQSKETSSSPILSITTEPLSY